MPVVLVPDRDRSGGIRLVDAVGNEKHGGNAVVLLDFVSDGLDAVAILADRFAVRRLERTGFGPGAAEAVDELLAELVGALHDFGFWRAGL